MAKYQHVVLDLYFVSSQPLQFVNMDLRLGAILDEELFGVSSEVFIYFLNYNKAF